MPAALLLGLLVPRAPLQATPRARHQYLVVAATARCPGPAGGDPAAVIRADRAEFDRRLRERVPPAAIVASQEVATATQLLDLTRRARAVRVTVLISGHGMVLPDGQSALCLDGPALPLARLLDVLEDGGASEAVLIVNACQSARVDVRRPKLRASLLSASPYDVAAGAARSGGPSVWAQRAADLIGGGSLYRDCLLDDDQLVRGLRHAIDWHPISNQNTRPRPQLRRQGRVPIPVVELESQACADRVAPLAPDAPDPLDRVWVSGEAPSKLPRGEEPGPKRLARLPGPRPQALTLARAARGYNVFEARVGPGDWSLWRLPDGTRVGGADLPRDGSLLRSVVALLPALDQAQAQADRLLVRFGGRAPLAGLTTVDAFRFDAASLTAIPCPDEEDGQCFEIPMSGVRQSPAGQQR